MAGTSKQTDSSCFPSSSSFKFWDVFLSFGGKDTRRSFIGHLYSALDQVGIRTFKDELGLERGEQITPQLIKAIHDSKMSIVVFSKDYASSKWCLNELAEILECERTKGQIVLPVFYDVDPLNVRHQTESYAEAFEKHKIRHAEKVETWRAALTTTANISGYDLKNDANGHEADFIQKIVNDVLMKLCPKNLNVTDHQVGIDSRVKEICQKLSIGSNDVRFIGIYGMPGIGKTTIVKALYNKIYKKFEGSCFLENVREAFEEPRGLHYLLEQLIFQLLKIKDFKVTSVDTGISFVKQRLRSKKVLIVLDDLDKIKQLESLAGNWNWFGPGSRIIVTTRDSRLLVECQVDLRHEVEELDGNESLKLFRRHAFRNTTPMKNLMELSKDIVKYVGGLPLALEVLGSSLFDRPMVQWESVFGKLKKIPHKDIQKKLRISYVALDDDIVQDIFLDIACFFIGMDKDNAFKILDACGFFPEIGISNLRERCLLKIDWSNRLCMHNLIQDMGREIVREESVKNPRKRSRLWFHEDAYDVLKNSKGHGNIEGIRLVMPMQEEVDISTRAFHNLPNLRLLQISNVNLTGSFENLFEELRWFCWNYSYLDCLPSSFQAPKLVFLDMQHSKVKILWEGTKQLQGLKVLNASYSRFLKTTPDFKGLESLEKLILQGCSSLSQIHPSIELLHNLVHLDLNECYSLNQLPEQLGNMGCLRKLDARFSSIEQLPDSIRHLGKLEKLDLDGCKDLRNLPSSICDLTSLVHLSLSCCSNLESLPENLGNITSLTDLDVCATNIMQLPDSIRFLTRLKNLNISFCKRLMNTRRRIYNPSSLQTLPSNLSQLVNSEDLDVSDRLSRQSLLELPPNLEQLFANDCTSLDILPDLSGMKHLIRLAFIECSSLQSLPKLPPNLITLKLSNCTSLQFLLELPLSLQTLELINCPSLQSLPKFPPLDLRKVYLTNCTCLESLPELPPVLCELDLNNCTSLKSLPELPTHDLIRLSLTNCTSLESLPELPTDLLILNLTNCTSLESLPELPTELVVLNLTNYTSLESLPELPLDLRILYLINWSSLESLPELPPDLEVLYLNNCNRLLSVPKLPPNLKDLRLINCTSLRSLPKLPCKLGYLDLTDCSSLESLQELPCHLDYLKASGCKSLQKLPDLSNLTNLSTLILTDCSDLISNFIWSCLQDGSGLDGCDVYLPSRVIQDRFCHHKRTGSSISFQLPGDVKSMAFWVVFGGKLYSRIEAVITNETDGTQFKHWISVKTTGVHSWVRYIGKPISMKSGDRIEVSFGGRFEYVTVEMCGVHLDCKRVRDVDVVEPLCPFKRLKHLA